MGIFGAIAEGVVAIRYDAKIDGAVKAVKELSGEQKKAAKQAIEAHKEERAAFKAKVEDFAKGAAIIGGAIAVGRSGLKAYREETRLMAGAAGVDIDRLSDSWDGLKTRMDLLTLAQAGHRGAWKLTTGQLEQVSEGMRALEAKGYDASQIFDKFTDVLKKGKIEGLDDFGLSLKSTGDQTKDLQVLLRALNGEVDDVGGAFGRATDPIDRATVSWTDSINRVRSAIGQAVTDLGTLAGMMGRIGGSLFGGGGGDVADGSVNGKAAAYAQILAMRRGGVSGAQSSGGAAARRLGGAGFQAAISGGPFAGVVGGLAADRQLFGANDADMQAARALANFQAQVRRGLQGKGPLASSSPTEFAEMVAGLPADWRAVDEELGKRVDQLGAQLDERFKVVGVDAARGILTGFNNALSKNRDEEKKKRRGRGGGSKDNLGPGLFFGAASRVGGIVDALAGLEDQRAAEAAAAGQAQADALAAYQEKMSQRFADAQMLQDMEAWRTAKAKSDEESFLAKTFGPLEEFDQYAAGFATLKGAVQDGFAAWIDGSESLGTAIQKSIAGSLRAYAIEMSGKALVAGAEALFYLAQGNIAGATAMGLSAAKYVAAAGALGMLAKGLGGSGVAASAAGVPSGSPGGARPAPQSGVVIVGDPLSDDSPRERQRRVRRAMNAAGRPNEGVRYG